MKLKKRKVTATRKHPLFSKAKRSKGALDAGTIYGVLLLAILLGGGALMLGNATPRLASPDTSQPVIIQKKTDNTLDPNLQLKDFPGITITPTPTPTMTPTPTPTTPPPAPAGGGSSGGGSGSGGGGGSTCFVAGTKILMANGTQKNIEDVKIGDMVMGYDGKKQVAEKVYGLDAPIRDHHYNVILADGTIIGVTNEHPLYTSEGWKSISPQNTLKENPQLFVGTLKVGDKVLKSSGKYVAITGMIYKPGAVQAYNLKNVSGYNNFYADGVLSHNKGGGGGGSGGGGGGGGGSSGGSAG